MKNSLLLITSLLFLIACDPEESVSESLKTALPLVGQWKLVEQKVSIGGPATWQKVDNGDTFTLKEDGSFSNLQIFGDCSTGTFEATDDELILTYNCADDTKPFTYALKRDNEAIILSPKTVICTDGCEYKYQKTSE